MGIFDLFRQDESAEWAPERKVPLVLNLPSRSLNGIALGARGAALSQLGRPANPRPFREGRFHYERLGIAIELQNECVHYFGFPVCRRDTDEAGPCEVTVVFPNGERIPVNNETDVMNLLAYLPSPREMDTDDEETVYFIDGDGYHLELEVSPEGRMFRVNLCAAAAD